MIKAVIFDLFHTLTAPESDAGDLPWTSDVLGITRDDWHRALTRHTRARLTGEISDPAEIVRLIAHSVIPTITAVQIADAAMFRKRRFARTLTNIPERNLEVLRELKRRGKSIALISNGDVAELEAWPHSPLNGLFDVEAFSCRVGCVKPEREIYLECLRRLGLDPAEAVFVGDGGSDELRGAREAGMRPILFSGIIAGLWPERIEELAKDADAHIARLDELLSLPLLWSPDRAEA